MTRALPCGLYRTTEAIEETVPAGVLVYYHNHGDPGPGVYLPRGWKNNRALFHEHGTTVPDARYAETLEPLAAEGLYRVREPFYCCEQRCQYFEEELLVQLGYNGQAQAILFTPELVDGALAIPATGTIVDRTRLAKLAALKVPASRAPEPEHLQ
ncbi:MAG: hypothetical protein IT371_00735 [Deltaproteobacteria bacterium]|nr:hypothetical protein [Deltaproteobacteria bacterium]